MYTPVLDDKSLESGLGMVKHGFQSMLVLFVKRDTYPYEMDNKRSLENVGGIVVVDEITIEFRESSEDQNDISSGEDAWPDLVTEKVEEEEEVEFPIPTMGVPPLEENDEPYPDSWIRVMEKDAIYTNTMVLGVDEDNVPPPVGVEVGQRTSTWPGGTAVGSYAGLPLPGAREGVSLALELSALLGASPLYRRPTLLEERALQDGPLGSRWNIRRTNATNPGRNLVLYRTELNHQRSYQVTPPEEVEHVTRISWKGRAGEDWATYEHDYVARWEAKAESVVTGSRAHTPRHAPSDYMTWYLSVTRRFVSPPPTKPAMVYHPRGCTEEALLGCVRNVVERVNRREALYPSSTDPYLMEIGHYCQSVLDSLSLLEGAIVDRDVPHAGELSHVVEPTRDRAPRGRRVRRRPTSETTTRVEDSDEVPSVSKSIVSDLPPKQTPEPEPDQPVSPVATLPSEGFILEGRKRQLVHQPSSAL
ncbi:hypothetical protein H6P81_009327 [Aristolochia fimbriata]|uniref:Uncharacterized protein n=1 Tax=Aristolochia fimbriata TaxID=158543 RepID=A0AAV7EKJ4_ARIFI|nr:hypothetical protein H6P81_009327 [Aristolochia fimbriata]